MNSHLRPPARCILFLVTLLLAAPALACNLPVSPPGSDLPAETLRSTLVAQSIATQAAGTLQAIHPTPGAVTPASPIPPAVEPFPGLATATPISATPAVPGVPSLEERGGFFTYFTLSGDTLSGLAGRFNVSPEEITSTSPLPPDGLIPQGILVNIPNRVGSPPYPSALLPDGEVVYSPAVLDFDLAAFIEDSGGYLSTYGETVREGWVSGAEIVRRVAIEQSVNPRLLLAFIEFRSGWVRGQPSQPDIHHPLGFYVPESSGLYLELGFAATQLNLAYYGWRQGTFTQLALKDGSRVRLSPGLNAGSVALQHLVALFYRQPDWQDALYGPDGLMSVYMEMFGDPWIPSAQAGPLFPPALVQPPLELPFLPGERWSFTGGPHAAWNTGTPRGAIDFSPVTGEPACTPSSAWVTAPASGVVARSEFNVLALDLDGDGSEATGWVLVFLHLAEQDRLPTGMAVQLDDRLGHPSCERGRSTGTHVHLARKFNGEWLPAGAPLAMVLSGWEVVAGAGNYTGELRRAGEVVSANPGGSRSSVIIR